LDFDRCNAPELLVAYLLNVLDRGSPGHGFGPSFPITAPTAAASPAATPALRWPLVVHASFQFIERRVARIDRFHIQVQQIGLGQFIFQDLFR
jgi:hypothetical protein